MTETSKTMVFVTAAVIALLAAFVITPSGEDFNVEELVGEKLNQFEINAPKKMKIIRFDADTGTPSEFEVAEKDNLWVIPSKQDYPADADKQMGNAAASVANLEVLRIAAQTADGHADLGVISPSSSNLNSKTEGVGTRVVMTDGSGESLVDMIVGNQVKDAGGQRYVRNTDQDIVYVTELDPKGLTTNFDDWIEGDLLGLTPFDIRTVQINDYSAELLITLRGAQVNWDRRGKYTLQYDNTESKWVPELLQQFDHQTDAYVDQPLPKDKELNADALKELKDALDDLTIVDVEQKPEGLSADLKAGSDFLKNNEAAGSLAAKGFAPVALSANAKSEILSSEGELICTLSDGVEYVLRFGNLKIGDGGEEKGVADSAESPTGSDSSDDSSDDQDTPDEEEEPKDEGIHRYLFVTARFNENMIERPEPEELPALPQGASEDQPAKENEEDDQKAQVNDTADDPATEETAEGSDDPAAEEFASEGEESSNPSPQDQSDQPTDTVEEGDKPADATDGQGESDELEKIISERKRIRAENERKEDEYKNKLDDGRKQVQQLNERFGDWYYVISNDLYKKIRLGRDQLVKEKEKEEDTGEGNSDDAKAEGENASPLHGLPNLPVDETETEAESPSEEEPTTDAPNEEEAKAEEPASDAPKEEEAKTEEPAAEEPASDQVESDRPAGEQPPAEESPVEEPTVEEPQPEQPQSDAA